MPTLTTSPPQLRVRPIVQHRKLLSPFAQFVRKLRKAELHMHLEGSVEPEFALERAERYNVPLAYSTPKAMRQAYNFNGLQQFLDLYYANCSILLHPDDFYQLTWAYLLRAKADGVVHVAPFCDPQTHTLRGLRMDDIIPPIADALKRGQSELGISWNLVPCFRREFSPEAAEAMFADAIRFSDDILGFGLDSTEKDNPPSKVKGVFAQAKAFGYRRYAHAGEEAGPEYIEEALDDLEVDQIDHGNACLRKRTLIDRLVASQCPLTVCPTSNVALGNVASLRAHPIRAMLAFGLNVSIHSDDPAYFGGYIGDVLTRTAEATLMTPKETVQIVNNGIRSAVMDDNLKQQHIRENDRLLAEHMAAL